MAGFLMANPKSLNVYEEVSMDRQGDSALVTMPYSKRAVDHERYISQLKKIEKQSGVKDVFFIYHENRLPGLVGLPHYPVAMACLHEAVDIVKNKFPGSTVYEVVGHTHSIPEGDFRIETPDRTILVPVGPDIETMTARILIIKPQREVKSIKYDLV